MLTRSRRLPAVLPFLALMLLLTGCGVGEIGDDAPWDDDDEEREPMFKHPPPSGPAPWTYCLTSYGGPSDKSAYLHSVACGGKKPDGKWWYSTGAWSFGCFSRLELCANGKCAVVKVVDNGPAGWVESKAKSKCGGTGYIIDASPLVSKYLHGKSSAGWSDCLKIKVRPVAGNTPTGPSSGASSGSGSCHTGQTFGWEYCSPSCRCGKGMGDCDSDADCSSGLQCAHNVGAAYGAGDTVDVCEEQPDSGGGNNSYGDCYYGGELGTCQPDNLPCSGSYKGSLCPGPNNVRCCMPPSSSGGTSTYGSCTYSGKTGTCQSTSISCSGGYASGLCPGGNDIKCCLPTWGSCSSGGQTGTCQLTSKSCSSSYKTGLCPGPNDVKCCL